MAHKMRQIKRFIKPLLIILPVALITFFLAQDYVIYDAFIKRSSNLSNTNGSAVDDRLPDNKPEVQIVVIACMDSKNGVADFQRHLDQLEVLFKSAAVLTSTIVKFNIITNVEEMYKRIINVTTKWPTKYSQRLRFGFRNVYYSPDLKYLEKVYRICASEKIQLPDIFEDLDALILLDTDTYFMQPPEKLWAEFQNFEDRQVIGLTPHLDHYSHPFNNHPVYGLSGINSGVLLMNITRIKTFPLGWHKSIRDVLKRYSLKTLKFMDQDILNVLFSGENEAYAYEVGCEWNYAVHMCQRGRQLCPGVASKGVALMHVKGWEIQGIYDAWDKYDLRSPVEELMILMEEGIKRQPLKKCSMISNINDNLLKGLMKHLASML